MITPEYLAQSGTEHGEQAALFCWAQQNAHRYPDLRWMFAIPNGGERTKSGAAKLKAEGVKTGVSDIFLPVARTVTYWPNEMNRLTGSNELLVGNRYGLWIEMKRAVKPAMSHIMPSQLDFGTAMRMRGYQWCVAFGWLQAKEYIESYLNATPL